VETRQDSLPELRHTRAEQQQYLQLHLHIQQGILDCPTLLQYTNVPTNAKIGIVKGASTNGAAILTESRLQTRLLAPGAV